MSKCKVDGCGKVQKSLGLCTRHLYRHYRYGSACSSVLSFLLCCSNEKCSRLSKGGGFCKRCKYKLSKYGSLERTRPTAGVVPFAESHPDIAQLVIGGASPHVWPASSHRRVVVKCAEGHETTRPIFSLVKGKGRCIKCPIPGHRICKPLRETDPHLANELMDDADSITRGSSRVCDWWCLKCNHVYRKAIFRRTSGQKSGCPKCALGGFREDSPAWLYLLSAPGRQKLGITNTLSTTNLRFKRLCRDGWTVQDLYGPFIGKEIKEMERALKRALDFYGVSRGADAFRDKFDGYTEAWQTVEFEAKTIAELVAALLPGVKIHGTRKEANPQPDGTVVRRSTGWLACSRQKMLVEA